MHIIGVSGKGNTSRPSFFKTAAQSFLFTDLAPKARDFVRLDSEALNRHTTGRSDCDLRQVWPWMRRDILIACLSLLSNTCL